MTALDAWLLLALWSQGVLAFILLLLLGSRRVPLVAQNKVAVEDIAVSGDAWPESAKLASNAFSNQFQLPVLFFVAGLCALYLRPNGLEVGLAWLFVFTRVVHAAIHVTDNNVTRRFSAYALGFAALVAFWIELAVRLVPIALGMN